MAGDKYYHSICINWNPFFQTQIYIVKFGLSEKHTKFEKIFLMVLTNQLIYSVNVKTMREIFFQIMCASQKVRTLKAPKCECCEVRFTSFWNFLKWGLISIDADSGPLRYLLWWCGSICHQPFTFFQIVSGHTVHKIFSRSRKLFL